MLRKCSTVLLLTGVKDFGELYSQLAEECGVNLRYESAWSDKLRIREEVVICGGKHLDSVNKAYYANTVVILRNGESPYEYIKRGINRFIFDHENKYELFLAFFQAEKIFVRQHDTDLKTVLEDAPLLVWEEGDYSFDFKRDRFFYKGKGLYMTDVVKAYLAEWLLNGRKDNDKRMYLCNLRKKFGAGFLRDVDRFGRIKEEKK